MALVGITRVVNVVFVGVVVNEVCVLVVEYVAVLVKGAALTAFRLQAELRISVANVCKGPGVDSGVGACRGCRTASPSLAF